MNYGKPIGHVVLGLKALSISFLDAMKANGDKSCYVVE